MTDYVWGIGSGDEMMIRDTGGNVEFWFHSDASTWNNEQDWGWSIDGGGWNMGVFKLNSGGAWHHLGTIYVGPGGNRQVGMRMVGEGLGWPTSDRFVTLPRATAPPAPTMNSATAVSASEVDVVFSSAGDGGTPVREWQLAYSNDPNGGQYYIGSSGTSRVGGLTSGQWWYFWARGRNDIGWGAWSGRAQAFTWRAPDAPTPVTFSEITQTSLRTQFSGQFDGGEPVDEWQLAYSLTNDPATATTLTANSGISYLTDLSAGRQYYFWARGRNAVGWGPYSAVRVATLTAGALVKDGLVYKRAVPYVNDEGVWRLARGMAKASGTWKLVP